jgi:site-specific recombinase XerD
MFRKTFASLLVENGMSLYDLQLLLDHTRVSTTQLYVQTRQDRGLKSYTSHNNWKLN